MRAEAFEQHKLPPVPISCSVRLPSTLEGMRAGLLAGRSFSSDLNVPHKMGLLPLRNPILFPDRHLTP
jgi:hypothetical protein